MDNLEVVTFLESHSNTDGWDSTHKKLVDTIINDRLTTLEIDPSEDWIYQGVQLTQNNGRETLGRVDIIALSPEGILLLIVAKTVNSDRNLESVRNEIERKLQEYSEYFIERFGIHTINYGACHIRNSGRLIVYTVPLIASPILVDSRLY